MWSLFSRDPSKDFAYEINEVVLSDEKSLWILHKGKKKSTGEQVSIFRYECKPNEESYMELAKNSLKRLKTLRHPSILTYIDSLETDKYILIVTEFVEPLQLFLNQMSTWSEQQKEYAISWGILSVAKGLCFLNNDCKLIHGNLSLNAIFINNLSDWKIFNFEYVTNIGGNQPQRNFYFHKIYVAPEITNNAKSDKQIDSWGLSCLIWEIYNDPMSDQSKLKDTKNLPKKLIPSYSMLNKNCSRCLVQDFINKGQEKNGYFKNIFIDTMNFLEEIQIKDSTERNRFFANLNNLIGSFPVYFCKNKILPFVITSLEYGDANAHSLDLLIKIGKLLDEDEYQKKIISSIIKLFASKDRSIRSKLLKEIEEYIDFIPSNLINEQIFPFLIHGFLDSNPVIREQTVKSIFYFAPKLNNQNLNDEVIKHLSRIQIKDPEGGIRTNTIICLGKIAAHFNPQTRQHTLLPLFLNSLRDPFSRSRIACIQSIAATQNFFTLQDCTTKIMPTLCLILMDPEKQVRDQAFTTLKNFIIRIEKFSENPALIEQLESEINKSGSNVSASKFASSLSWAVSSLAAKLTRSKFEQNPNENHLESDQQNQIENQQDKKNSITEFNDKIYSESNVKSKDENKILDSELIEGWGEYDWDEDIWKEIEVKPQDIRSLIDSSSSTKIKKQDLISQTKNNSNDNNGWDEEIDWGIDTSQEDNSKIKRPMVERKENILKQTKPKKGPMKLGAQKLKKPFD